MSNDVRYPMDLPSVYSTHGPDQTVHEFMVPLLEALSRKRPLWYFVCSTRWGAHFTVFEQGRELGIIERGTRYGNAGMSEEVYRYTNPRVNKKLKRKVHAETKDPDKAAKGVIAQFYARTPMERLQWVQQWGNSKILAKERELRHAMASADAEFIDHAMQWVRGNIATLPTQIQDRRREQSAAKELHQQYLQVSDTSVYGQVVEVGDMLFVQRAGKATSIPRSAAHPELLMAMGMLKLMDEGDIEPTLGLRAGANEFTLVWRDEWGTPSN